MDAAKPGAVERVGAVARDVRAHHAAADQHSDVHGQTLALQRAQIIGHACGRKSGLRPAQDRREIGQNLVAVLRAEGRGGQSAVAVDDGRQPLPQLQLPEAGAEGGEIGVAVNVQKARRDGHAARVECACGRDAAQHADGRDASVLNANICCKGSVAGAIQHAAMHDLIIQHKNRPLFA